MPTRDFFLYGAFRSNARLSKIITADGNLHARVCSITTVGNAIKYGAEAKRTSLVKVMADTDTVQVSVTNYGYVIPAEELPLIFDKSTGLSSPLHPHQR